MQIDGRKIKSFFLRHGYLLIIAAWLITLSFLVNNYWWYISSPTHVQKLLEQNIQNREKKFLSLVSDEELMNQLLNRDYEEDILKKYTGQKEDFYLYFYKNDWETFWTTNQIALDSSVNSLKQGGHFKKLKSGYYEIIRKNLSSNSHVLGVIPVKEEYYFSNRYLPNRFYQLPRISNQYEINKKGSGLPVRSITGNTLFFIKNISGGSPRQSIWLSGILLALAILSINIFFNQLAVFVGKNTKPWWGWGFLVFIFVFCRLLNYLGIVSLGFSNFDLFDSTIYASNLILKSLGDLLINVILVGWLIFYIYNRLRSEMNISSKIKVFRRYLFLFLINIGLFYFVNYMVEIIKGLVIDSKISFDITDFFSLDLYSFIGFIILGLLGFSFFFLAPIVRRIQKEIANERILERYVLLGLSGFLWVIIQLGLGGAIYSFWVMLWVIGYLCLMDFVEIWLQKRYSLERFILWMLVLTLTITAIVIHYNKSRELNYRKQLVIKLTKQKDPTLIFNLSMLDTVIVKDPYVVSFYKNFKTREKTALKDYLLDQYFSNLQNKYDFEFYTFDQNARQRNIYDRNAREVAKSLTNTGELTDFKNLYFKRIDVADYYYVATLPVADPDSNYLLGYLYYSLTPKAMKSKSLYPELLMKTEDYRFESAVKKYAYAVYDHRKLVYHKNGYPFPLSLGLKDIPAQQFNHIDKNKYSILRYKTADNKVIVMVEKRNDILEMMTLFAYLFGIFLLIVLLFNIFYILLKSRLKFRLIRELTRLNIRNKVYAIIIFIVLFVFVVLGVSTIQFFINRYDAQHKEQIDYEINRLLARVQQDFDMLSDSNAIVHFEDLSYNGKLKKKIQTIAKQEGVDINIYDLNGELRISTQNLIYKNGLLSKKMDPVAYYNLQFLHQVQVAQNEHVGNLSFLSSYVPIRSRDGDILAFLNLPNYSSQSNLKSEISNFLVTLINLNAFIFLLAGLLALIFTHSITRSFTLIIEKLKTVKLTGKNEEIDWKYDDEIGRLVEEYNKMVHKLEESAEKLARSEREGAWREMARQVAHEIKNPLTPMKLSLQHLQYAIKNDSPRKDELTNNVAQTIIEQIDHLAKIASDFSAFASISHTHNEVVVLNEILSSVVALHQGYETIDLKYENPAISYQIMADKTQINRVFTNLIQNAMQAIPEDRKGKITVRLEKEEEQTVIVQITDNGIGIEKEVRKRIFTPNFTTKSSGTGLGLAICQKIIQKCEGEISMETKPSEGTTFFVKLPTV